MELIAEKRTEIGKAAKSLIKEGKIPAVIFGKDMESLPIVVTAIDYNKVYRSAGETDLIDVKVGKDAYKILIKNSQFDPVSGHIIHAELFKPNLKEKIEAQIPVDVINEDINPFVKTGEAVVLLLINEITVKALPTDLPHSFIVDALKLVNIGDSVEVGALEFDKSKVELVDIELDEDVVKLDKVVIVAEEEVPAEVTEAEAIAKLEATGEKEPEEGEDADKGNIKASGKKSGGGPGKGDKV